jgi:hypothetical protein
MRPALFILAIASMRLFAQEQPEPRLISVQLSRRLSIAPDLAVVTAYIYATQPMPLAEVVAMLKPAGFTETDLAEGGIFSEFSSATYTFTRQAPFSQLRAILTTLNGIRGTESMSAPRIRFRASVLVSDALTRQAQDRALPALIQEARREADAIAVASRVKIKELAAVHQPAAYEQWFDSSQFPATVIPMSRIDAGRVSVYLLPIVSPPTLAYRFDFLIE